MNAKEMVNGAVKNVQARLTPVTPEIKDMVERRWKKCEPCRYRGIVIMPVVNTKHDGCTLCGCPFAQKLKLRNETCPRNPPLWVAE